MKLKLPIKEHFKSALRLNRWPVNWFNEKKDKENELVKEKKYDSNVEIYSMVYHLHTLGLFYCTYCVN